MTNYTDSIPCDSKKFEPTKITKSETIRLVKDILEDIDPNLEWLDIYEEMIDKNKIAYINEFSSEEVLKLEELMGVSMAEVDDNACIILNNKKSFLLLTYTGTLIDVVTTIHEVIHYISRSKNNYQESEPMLREFYSIFYELYAIKYLEKIGYDKNELEAIKNGRLIFIKAAVNERKYLLDYLNMYIDNGVIREEDDYGYDRYGRCDMAAFDLISNPYILNDYYPYVIGNYLASEAIKKIDDDKTLFSIIKYMTVNSGETDAYDLFNVIGVGNANLVRIDDKLIDRKVQTKKKK